MKRRSLLVLTFFVLLAGAGRADAPKRTHDITLDDYFTQADIFDSKISPDGKFVAYVEGRWQKSSDDRKTDLWVVDTTGTAKAVRLTDERANDRSPQWSGDGRYLYFLGNRKRGADKEPPYNGKTQVWRLNLPGGKLQPVTTVGQGVDSFVLARDGRSLYYIIEVEHVADDPWKSLRQKFKHIDYGDGVGKLSQVWQLDLESWRAEKLIEDHRVIREMAISPVGGRIAMITTPDAKVVSFEGRSRVDLYDSKSKKVIPLPDKVFRSGAPSPYGWLENLAWAQDGTRLAFNVVFDAYPAEVIVGDLSGPNPNVFKMPRPPGVSLRGYGSPLAWSPDGALGFLGEEKGRVRLYQARGLKADGEPNYDLLTPDDVVVSNFSFSNNGGQPAVIMNYASSLPDIYLLEGGKARKRLTRVNPQADSWKLPQISTFSWKGANGDPVEGILELPPDYKPGQRLPLVVEIHGGPTTAAYLGMQFWIYGRTLLPAKGYAVLCPNYRGSTGYGDKFLTDLVGRENDLDVQDILAGVDALVERGIADPERLAVSGWSNGGFLTNCIITKTTRFKAAISGAGIIDALLEFGSNDEPAYAIVFKGGLPWTAAARYHKASPSYGLGKVRTPTLIHVGGEDERCPPANSRMLYRALREYVKVPTELLVYPGEPHGLMKYKNRRAKMQWDLAWLERYVLGRGAGAAVGAEKGKRD
jgi:dipeptidyl aminopeptidase/acylaminoacyl peptidase